MSGYDTKNVDSKYEQHTEEKKGREREKRNRKEERGGESSREKMTKSNAGIYSVVS